jgi:excinuclease ABC subunit C
MVAEVCKFLCGKSKAVEEELDARMREASEALKFEEAARLRDQLRAVREVVRKQRVVFDDRVDRDVLGLVRGPSDGCAVVLQIRDGKLVGQEHYLLSALKNIEAQEIVSSFLKQYYRNAYFIPDEIILPLEVDDVEVISTWLRRVKQKKVRLVVPRRGEKCRILAMAKENALYRFREETLKKSKQKVPFSLRELQRVLSLEQLPRIIEAFDVSNLFGTNASGSVVVFKDGKPKKSDYRRFRIRAVDGIDDYAMMREIVHRRYRRTIDHQRILPHLILIDGGLGHLTTAKAVMGELELSHIPIFGLAKRLDEIVSVDGKTMMLPKSSFALRVLQHLRDEAHRFAVNYHRKLRGKRFKKSILDDIAGIGEKKKRELVRYFGSAERMREASPEEIGRVRGVGRVLALRIFSSLHPE